MAYDRCPPAPAPLPQCEVCLEEFHQMDMFCAWGSSHQQKPAAGAKEVLDTSCGHYCCQACMQVRGRGGMTRPKISVDLGCVIRPFPLTAAAITVATPAFRYTINSTFLLHACVCVSVRASHGVPGTATA